MKQYQRKAIKLANECFKAVAEEQTITVCKAYSGMNCIHPRYLPKCKGCPIQIHKEKEKETAGSAVK